MSAPIPHRSCPVARVSVSAIARLGIVRLIFGVGAFLLTSAYAASAQAATCSVSASPLSFGNYNVLSGNAALGTSTISIGCRKAPARSTENMSVSVFLSTGPGTYANRTMLSGANTLNYNLYVDTAYTLIWGDRTQYYIIGTFQLTTARPNLSYTHTVYGRVPGGQDVPPGVYTANVTVTITF